MLHGLGLFGVILADMPLYAFPPAAELFGLPPRPAGADAAAHALVVLLAQTKFFTILTLLFGASLALLENRAEDSAAFARAYARRLAALFALGIGQTILFWHSILLLYAPLGLAALALRALDPKRRLRVAAGLLLAGALLPTLGLLLAGENPLGGVRLAAQEAATYSSAAWGAAFKMRMIDLARLFAPLAVGLFALRTLGLILLGHWLLGAGLFREDQEARGPLERLAWWGALLGLPLQVLALWAEGRSGPVALAARWLGAYFGGLCLGLAYAGAAGRLCLEAGWRSRLAPLAAAGRLCLSNYLLASAIMAWAFAPWGLGLFGRLGHAALALAAAALFASLCALGWTWTRAFRFGPFEWLVRAASYRSAPRMRTAP